MTDIILVRTRDILMKDVGPTIIRYQQMMPRFEIFLDGDLKAIVARERKKAASAI